MWPWNMDKLWQNKLNFQYERLPCLCSFHLRVEFWSDSLRTSRTFRQNVFFIFILCGSNIICSQTQISVRDSWFERFPDILTHYCVQTVFASWFHQVEHFQLFWQQCLKAFIYLFIFFWGGDNVSSQERCVISRLELQDVSVKPASVLFSRYTDKR